mmetsp:Transcript_34676/g.70795  ORF Transcript_34676/g.70795 Transcript_34676/m.70795 type:complete len:283 (+) Transcript_34676:1167-2015(+)
MPKELQVLLDQVQQLHIVDDGRLPELQGVQDRAGQGTAPRQARVHLPRVHDLLFLLLGPHHPLAVIHHAPVPPPSSPAPFGISRSSRRQGPRRVLRAQVPLRHAVLDDEEPQGLHGLVLLGWGRPGRSSLGIRALSYPPPRRRRRERQVGSSPGRLRLPVPGGVVLRGAGPAPGIGRMDAGHVQQFHRPLPVHPLHGPLRRGGHPPGYDVGAPHPLDEDGGQDLAPALAVEGQSGLLGEGDGLAPRAGSADCGHAGGDQGAERRHLARGDGGGRGRRSSSAG